MPDDRTAIFADALRLAQARRFDEADGLVRRSSSKPAKDAPGLAMRGRLAIVAGRPAEARTLVEKSLKVAPSVEGYRLLAQYHLLMVENDLAAEAVLKAVGIDERDPGPRIEAAAVLIEIGRVDEAAEVVRPAIHSPRLDDKLAPRLEITRASIEIQQGDAEAAAERLEGVLATDLPRGERHGALDLLAKASDRIGRFDRAFEAASIRNREAGVTVDVERMVKDTDALIASTTRADLERWPQGLDDPRPVFVAGMPRSGTSLVDRIIDAHGRAAGVGELPLLERFAAALQPHRRPGPPPGCFGAMQDDAWRDGATAALRTLEDRGGSAERIVNKSLANDRLLGLASRLLPGARVLHVVRDPRDVAVSCHLGRFSDARLPWTTDLAAIAVAWEQSRRLMDHWKSVLDLPILEVRYERLVRDPDVEFPRIIEFLGLDWDDSCRRFHETSRPLRTLSFDQVNRPLYTSSVGRHRNYESHLGGVEWPSYEP